MSTAPQDPAAGTPLASALEKSDTVAEAVERAADELLVINTVLKEEVPPAAKSAEVQQALTQADELGDKLQASVANLAEVSELLQQEVAERAELEQELAETRQALRNAQ